MENTCEQNSIKMNHKKNRHSQFELLRLICIIGIITMHTFGSLSSDGHMLLYHNAVNTTFNTGVSIFILISGYFGIKQNYYKLFSLWLQVILYSFASYLLFSYIGGCFDINRLIKSLFPILSNKYWFATSYVLLMIFAPYLNDAVKNMSHQQLIKLILSMLLLFSILPTCFLFELPGTGKGILHFTMMYIIGRYLALYPPNISTKKTAVYILLIFSCIFLINLTGTYIYRSITNKESLIFFMSRDCSIFIIAASIGIFLIFKELHIKSKLINKLAVHVFAIYLLDEPIRQYLSTHISLDDYTYSAIIFPLVAVFYIFLVITIAITIDCIRALVQRPIEYILCRSSVRLFSIGRTVFIRVMHKQHR